MIHPLPHHPDFRNPAGVGQKTRNVVDQHPDHSGSRSNGNRLDKEVLDEFLADPARMRAMAARMREQLAVGLASSPVGERGVPATVPPLGTAYKEAQPSPSAAER